MRRLTIQEVAFCRDQAVIVQDTDGMLGIKNTFSAACAWASLALGDKPERPAIMWERLEGMSEKQIREAAAEAQRLADLDPTNEPS